jgi:glycosyltransferase involved in cell wall biosynthesis
MRIAFISTVLNSPFGGSDTLWTHAAEAARARGDTLFISVSPEVAKHTRIAALAKGGARMKLRQSFWTPLGRAARLRRKLRSLLHPGDPLTAALRRFRPELVVFSFGGTYDFLLERPVFDWLLDSKTRYRIVANFQAENPFLPEEDRHAAARVLGGADAVFFVSRRNREATRRHLLAELPEAHVIHNPLRWRPADVSPWPAVHGWNLATVSRLEHGKGIHLLLYAAAHVLGHQQDWHLDIFGHGPAEAYLRETVSHLGLADRVHFRGYVPDLRSIWAQNHLMVSPAIDDGVPMTIPEAMLCERPVLATAVGGAEDWIAHGHTGFIAAAPTLPLIAAALREAWNAREHWQAMGHEGGAHSRNFYRPDEHRLLIKP